LPARPDRVCCPPVLERADDLAAMTVLDERGEPVVLATLWAERPAVLVFLRHFG